MDEAPHFVGEVFHPYPGFRPHQSDAAHKGAAHVVGLRAKDVFDPDPYGGFGPTSSVSHLRQNICAASPQSGRPLRVLSRHPEPERADIQASVATS